MNAVIAVAAALGLVGLGMLVSPDAGRLRSLLRRRKRESAVESPPPEAEPAARPSLRVIHGDGGAVLPFRPRRAHTLSSAPPADPRGNGPDAA